MTKFIYDTKFIMTRAWELARESAKASEKFHARLGRKITARDRLYEGLEKAWAEAKEAMVKAVAEEKAEKSTGGRYVELLTVAENNNLNHGRAWFCSDYDIECRGINPMFEGERVCYVYAN